MSGPILAPLPRVHSANEFLECVRRREPVLFRVDDVQESAWSLELEVSLRGMALPIRISNPAKPEDPPPRPYKQFWGYLWASVNAYTLQRMTLADVRALAGDLCWMVSGIDAALPASVSSVLCKLDTLTPEGSVTKKTGCWISSGGNTTPLHWDAFGPHNLHMLLCGCKHLDLFEHSEASHLYCYGGPRYFSRFAAAVDVARPDLERYPEYAKARGYSATLTAGDVLFIPAFWWHHAVHLGTFNVSATRWFDEPRATHPREPPVPRHVHLNGLWYLMCEPCLDLALCVATWLAAWLLPSWLLTHWDWATGYFHLIPASR